MVTATETEKIMGRMRMSMETELKIEMIQMLMETVKQMEKIQMSMETELKIEMIQM